MIDRGTAKSVQNILKEPLYRIQAGGGWGTELSVTQEEEKMREGWSTFVIDCRWRNFYHPSH